MRTRGATAIAVICMLGASGLAAAAPALPDSRPSPAVAASAARATAQVAASFTVRSDDRVRVIVTTDARRVLLRYRQSGSQHTVQRTVREHKAKIVLPEASRRIAVKAEATRRLTASSWVRATPKPLVVPDDPPAPDPVGDGPLGDGSAAVTDAQLTRAAATRVLFGHQSVGMNILDGVPAVYGQHGLPGPAVVEWPSSRPSGGVMTHTYIGENGAPLGKIADFADRVRATPGIDVAVMKLCFVDVVEGTDVQSVFRRYRDTLADLARQRPGVRLIYTTVPLTVGTSQDNVVRQRFNALIRNEYAASGRLLDIAAVESTRPDGSRLTAGGGTYLTLNPDYASDEGHLNERGSARVAAAFLRTIARAVA